MEAEKMPKTCAERKTKYIQKLKEEGRYEDYKKNKTDQQKERRKRRKESIVKMTDAKRNNLLAEQRMKNRKAVQKWRQNKKGIKTQATSNRQYPVTQPSTYVPHFSHSYKTSSALRKAVAKVKKVLPSSPSKRKAVVSKILSSFDQNDKENIIGNGTTARKKAARGLSPSLVRTIEQFYERDDISRISPNVKDARKFVNPLTGEKEVKQLRFAMYKLSEIYYKFLEEIEDENEAKSRPPVKMSKFCTLRPHNVKLVGQTPRNVCFCIYHSNFIQCCAAIHKFIPQIPRYGPELTEWLVCEDQTRDCYFKTCKKCATSNINDKFITASKRPEVQGKTVQWMQWVKNETENRYKNAEQTGTIEELISYFSKIYPKFLVHSYTKREQDKAFNMDRKSVKECTDVAVLQIDFAENYKCEAQNEIQPANYNQKQISLFTTALHHNNNTYSRVITSDSTQHTKETLIAYLYTIFTKLPLTVKEVKIWSDGPYQQFKNKFIAAVIPVFEDKFGVKIVWNFFATAHGKGCIDGIGAAVKKKVKTLVLSEEVIVNQTSDFVKAFNSKKSEVDVIELTAKQTDQINDNLKLKELFCKVPAVRAISTFHQMQFKNNRINGYILSKDGYSILSSIKPI